MSQLSVYWAAAWSMTVKLWSACTVLALVMRVVPEARFVAFEKAYPRLGWLARAVRKFSTDLVPFAQAIVFAIVPPPPRGPDGDGQ